MFWQLYIVKQRRNGDLEDFFRHENSSSLTKGGMMRPCGNMWNLMQHLEPLCEVTCSNPCVQAHIIEGSVMVHQVRPSGFVQTFGSYANDVIIPHLNDTLKGVERFDAVWDVYKTNSLKKKTKEKCYCIPSNELGKISVSMKTRQSYTIRLQRSSSLHCFKINKKPTSTTSGDKVLSSVEILMENISPCNHEEADYRVINTACKTASTGMKTVMISTSDTDVVVIAK